MGRLAKVEVTPDLVSGSFDIGDEDVTQVALVIDGTAQSVSPVLRSEGLERKFQISLPPHVLGAKLDVLAVETGRSVLDIPYDLSKGRALHWKNLSVRNARIEGAFTLEGSAAPAEAVVQVDFSTDGEVCRTAFAVPTMSEDGSRTFHFTTWVPSLPQPTKATELAVTVGGVALPRVIEFSPQDCGFVGCVDRTGTPRVHGWAVDLANPARRVKLELRVDGDVVGSTIADRSRQDVQELGFGDGFGGFATSLPRDISLHKDHRIEVVIAGTNITLWDGSYVQPASPPYVGVFDTVEGMFAGGWVVNMHNPSEPLEVEAICEGEVVGSGRADLYRGDVENAGMPTARCGFRFQLERPIATLLNRDIYLRLSGTDQVLVGSPQQINQNSNVTRFLMRNASLPEATLKRLCRKMTYETRSTLISIVMPVFNTPNAWLIEAITSVLDQWSANWELICVDDCSTEPHVKKTLLSFSQRDNRVRLLSSPTNVGIAKSTNYGLRAARGQYVTFMDHDDMLEPDAIYKLAQAAAQTNADLIYSDEVLTSTDINSIIEVRARPAFSYDYYLSHPYFVHMVCVRTEVAHRMGGWDESLPISADVDFVLRVVENATTVTHVPSVLYRWRTHATSTGHARQGEVNDATKAALARHLKRSGRQAAVADGYRYNEYRVDWPDDGGEVLIVIPTKNRVDLLRTCINSIESTSKGENFRIVVIDHESKDPKTVRYLQQIASKHTIMPYKGVFNYALMNNLAVRTHGGNAKYVLFMNNDVEARENGWIGRLRSLAARPEVGAVGPLLLYGDDRVQHAGVLIAFSGAADHAMKYANAYLTKDKRHPGYNCNLTSVRDYSAVTAACMMVRRDVLTRVDGFDETFVVGFNDTDLCLRIGETGFKVLYDGFTVLYHHESATRTMTKEVDHPEDDARLRTRWAKFFTAGDPFYNPLLAPRGNDHTLRMDAGCKGRMNPRAKSLKREVIADTVDDALPSPKAEVGFSRKRGSGRRATKLPQPLSKSQSRAETGFE